MLDVSRREAALAAFGVLALATAATAAPGEPLTPIADLLAAHNKAFTAQDMNGVLATLSEKCVLMGTGPGELWIGHEEIRGAYTHFFEDFDKGRQSFENLWHDGHADDEDAWLMTMSKVTLQKGAGKTDFGLNVSVVCNKEQGGWKIRAMHFSNLTGPSKA